MFLHRELAVIIAHCGTRAATSTVAEQRDVFAGRQILNLLLRCEDAEFHEMISAAAGAELRPCLVLVLACHWTARPIFVQNTVMAPILKGGADAESRLGVNRACESILMMF